MSELKDRLRDAIECVGALVPGQPNDPQDALEEIERLEAKVAELERRLHEVGELVYQQHELGRHAPFCDGPSNCLACYAEDHVARGDDSLSSDQGDEGAGS